MTLPLWAVVLTAIIAATPGVYAAWVQYKASANAEPKRQAEIEDLVDQIEGRVLKRARDELERVLDENRNLHRQIARVRAELEIQHRDFIEIKRRYNEVCMILADIVSGVRMLVEQIRDMGETPKYEPREGIIKELEKHIDGGISRDI